jgi:hypothetical protein
LHAYRGVVDVAPLGAGPGIGVTGGVVIGVTGVTGVTEPGFAPGVVDGVTVPGVDPVVPVAPGVVESGCPAPFDGGVVDAPGPVPGTQGAITSAFGAPFEPIAPAAPVVPTAPGVAPGVVIVPGVALPLAGGTTPLVPVEPVSGTHGIVAGGVVLGVAGAATPDGNDGDCVPIDGVCAITGSASPSAATAAHAMKVEVLYMTPPYPDGGVCTARARYLDDTV